MTLPHPWYSWLCKVAPWSFVCRHYIGWRAKNVVQWLQYFEHLGLPCSGTASLKVRFDFIKVQNSSNTICHLSAWTEECHHGWINLNMCLSCLLAPQVKFSTGLCYIRLVTVSALQWVKMWTRVSTHIPYTTRHMPCNSKAARLCVSLCASLSPHATECCLGVTQPQATSVEQLGLFLCLVQVQKL